MADQHVLARRVLSLLVSRRGYPCFVQTLTVFLDSSFSAVHLALARRESVQRQGALFSPATASSSAQMDMKHGGTFYPPHRVV